MITDTVLIWLGSVAVLSSIGMFLPRMDRLTSMLLPFVSAIVWGLFAVSAFEVAITDTNPVATTEMLPMVYMGVGFSLSSVAFGIYEMVFQPAKDVAEATEESDFLGD